MSANLDYGSGTGLAQSLLEPGDDDQQITRPSRRREVLLCTYMFTVLTVLGGVCLRVGVERFAMKACHDFESSLSSGAPTEFPSERPDQVQHQTLCAFTATVAGPEKDVQCVYFDKMYVDLDFNANCKINDADRVASGCRPVDKNPQDTYVVVKANRLLVSPETTTKSTVSAVVLTDDEDGDPGEETRRKKVSTWLFYAAQSEHEWESRKDVGTAISRVAGAGFVDRASCTTLDEVLEEGPGGLVEKYRRGFAQAGATPEVTRQVVEYVELWDALRQCCGEDHG